MTKPDETKTSEQSDIAPDAAPPILKKEAAAPGTVTATDIAAGDRDKAEAEDDHLDPIGSSLLGDPSGQSPAASAKENQAAAQATAENAARPSAEERPDAAQVTAGPRQRSGFFPMVLGGMVAALLGSAATIWALPHLPAGWLPIDTQAEAPASAKAPAPAPAVDVEAIRAEAVSAAQNATSQQIEALRAELAAQPSAEEAAAVMPQDLEPLRQQIDQQTSRIEELAARPQIDPETAARVQTLAQQASTLEAQIQTAAQAAQEQINAAQAEAERLQQAAAEGTRRAEAVAAVAALQTALAKGVTPDQARQTLEGAGLEAPEPLTREVPALGSLQANFPEAARVALRASLRQDSAAGNGNLLTNFLRAQTGARSVEPREGADPDAVLSRAHDAVGAGRVGDAVTEIEALSEAARTAPAMADWLAGATAYRDAQAALSDLSAPSN